MPIGVKRRPRSTKVQPNYASEAVRCSLAGGGVAVRVGDASHPPLPQERTMCNFVRREPTGLGPRRLPRPTGPWESRSRSTESAERSRERSEYRGDCPARGKGGGYAPQLRAE